MPKDPKCPLCGSEPTEYRNDACIVRAFSRQTCKSPPCLLPCRLWAEVGGVQTELDRLRLERDTLNDAIERHCRELLRKLDVATDAIAEMIFRRLKEAGVFPGHPATVRYVPSKEWAGGFQRVAIEAPASKPQRTVAEDCARGLQRCQECPDIECSDNLVPAGHCPGGDGCTCCRPGCECGCRDDCPVWRATEARLQLLKSRLDQVKAKAAQAAEGKADGSE